MGRKEEDSQKLEHKLQGRTLQVYLYLLRKKEASGIREVQRDLGLSSPSVAEYQVEKLVELGLVSKDSYGRCLVARKVKVKALESYVNFGRFTVPRLSFYATVFSAVSALYVILNSGTWSVYGLAVPLAASAIFWYETWKMWKHSLLERAVSRRTTEEESHVAIPITIGIVAVFVFVSLYIFLFGYVEPNQLVVKAVPPIDPNGGESVLRDRVLQSQVNIGENIDNVGLSHASNSLEQNSSSATVLVLLSALAVGFIVYVIVQCRSYEKNLAY